MKEEEAVTETEINIEIMIDMIDIEIEIEIEIGIDIETNIGTKGAGMMTMNLVVILNVAMMIGGKEIVDIIKKNIEEIENAEGIIKEKSTVTKKEIDMKRKKPSMIFQKKIKSFLTIK